MIVLDTSMIIAVSVICGLSALTMPAGIGGGILFVPVLRLIAGMGQGDASALSQVLITGAAIGSILFQILWQKRHKEEPLLAQPFYVVLMMPALLSGSLVGVYLNKLLPEFVSLIVLVCICIVSSIMIFRKGFETFRREQLVRRTSRLEVDRSTPSHERNMLPPPPLSLPAERGISLISLEVGINVPPEVGLYDDPIEEPPQSFLYEDTAVITPSQSVVSISSFRKRQRSRRLSSVDIAMEQDVAVTGIDRTLEDSAVIEHSRVMRIFTKSVTRFVIFVIAYWVFIVLCTVLRGSKSHPSISGIEPCGGAYWALSAVQTFVGITIACFVAFKEIGLVLSTFGAGAVATISGASGGIILNPILLDKGLDPQQTSATTTIIMLVMSSCSALEFSMEGKIPPISSSLMAVTFVGSVIGMTFVTWLIKVLGRQSILVFLLGGLVVVGGGMLVYIGTADVISQIHSGEDPFELGTLC